MIATSPWPLSVSCVMPSLLAGRVVCQTDREGQKGNGNDKPRAKEMCCLPSVLFCTETTWKWDLSPGERRRKPGNYAHPALHLLSLCAGAGFVLLVTHQPGRAGADYRKA